MGSFVIANSLSITIAQRTREFATLRTLGATRRQVLRAILLESLRWACSRRSPACSWASALAKGLFALFDAVGFTLPNSGLVFQGRTVIVALLVGILVTVAASLRPALRATRVPPIAAVREGSSLPERAPSAGARCARSGSRCPASRPLVYGLFAPGLGTSGVLIWMGLGALMIFIGVALLSARLVPALAGALGWPAARWGGAVGRLARENAGATRSARRPPPRP